MPYGAGLAAALILAVWLGVTLLEVVAANGALVYTLDDPYIHLALAQRLQHGFYGINPGEPASPASSILFPFLLVPLADRAIGAWVPLALNAAALLGAMLVMARIWAAAGAAPHAVLLLSLAGAAALNWIGLAFTGLEHALHVLASLAVALGLWAALTRYRVAWWLVAALVAGPALRYEGLAVSGAALIVLWLAGARRSALAVGAAIAAVVGGFSAFLVVLGLPPLPSSVLVKQAGGVAAQLRASLHEPSGWLLIAAAVAFAATAAVARERRTRLIALFGLLVALAHMVAGRYGWLARYEIYALSTVLAAFVLAAHAPLAAMLGRSPRRALAAAAALSLLLLAACSHLLYASVGVTRASRGIAEQHLQLRRLAIDHLRGPVGVHDIGLVSVGNPHYVLDYWGLASEAMRRMRSDPARPRDWMDRAARAHDVDLALLYERVFAPEIPPGWIVLGRLLLATPPLVLEDSVTFYATRAAAVPGLRAVIAAWAPGLPQGVRYDAVE